MISSNLYTWCHKRVFNEISNTLVYIKFLLLTHVWHAQNDWLKCSTRGQLEAISDFLCGSGHVILKHVILMTTQQSFTDWSMLIMYVLDAPHGHPSGIWPNLMPQSPGFWLQPCAPPQIWKILKVHNMHMHYLHCFLSDLVVYFVM